MFSKLNKILNASFSLDMPWYKFIALLIGMIAVPLALTYLLTYFLAS